MPSSLTRQAAVVRRTKLLKKDEFPEDVFDEAISVLPNSRCSVHDYDYP